MIGQIMVVQRLVVVAVVAVAAVADVMQRYGGTVLPEDAVVSATLVDAPCTCKQLCHEDPECWGCTSIPRNTGRQHWCNTTSSNVSHTALVDAGPAQSVTYLKRPYCDAPYVEAEGVGCIFISTEFLSYDDAAKKGCPGGFRLFDPRTKSQFWRLADYLLREYAQHRDDDLCGPDNPLPDGTPAACDRDPDRGIQCCRPDGTCASPADCSCEGCVDYRRLTKGFWTSFHFVENEWKTSRGLVISSEKGSSLWSPNDPKDDGPCAAMWYAPASDALYHLATVGCDKPINFVCQKGI